MARTYDQCRRLAIERKLIAKYFGDDFQWLDLIGDTRVEGWLQPTDDSQRYKVRIALPPCYPDAKPVLCITDPLVLPTHGGRDSVNAQGLSHAYHTWDNGPDGCVRVCHTEDWDSSQTCVGVLTKAATWLVAYETHLRTGRAVADLLC